MENEVEEERYVGDRWFHSHISQFTSGISPGSIGLAYADWAMHLLSSPGKQAHLSKKAIKKATRFMAYFVQKMTTENGKCCIEPLEYDKRFSNTNWERWPFNFYSQAFLLTQQWLHNATTNVPGVTKHHENVVNFSSRQFLDAFSPSNSPLTNPEILDKTLQTKGQNLLVGYQNLITDLFRNIAGQKPLGVENFRVGETLATTPGKIVFRNDLIELIQYSPTTAETFKEPILFVPAWIMKYYILDLSAHNSMVRYLVDQGHTVFMISWKNPTASDSQVGWEDYMQLGAIAALNEVQKIVQNTPVHCVGYCIGGTLLSTVAAYLAREEKQNQIASLSFFTTQIDFSEAGELMLLIDESQVTFLEDIMWEQGFLDAKQMVGAFQLLHSNDLIWSKTIKTYMLGERDDMFDLMAWNADSTRLPFRMHSEYLRKLFLDNDFATGHFKIGSKPIVFSDIHVPIFSVAAEDDHIAPWKSVYKMRLYSDAPTLTFLLTKGGHNAGVVSEPGHKHRHFRMSTHTESQDKYIDPNDWLEITPRSEGSWWPTWQSWLAEHSSGKIKPPKMGGADAKNKQLADAPGKYVLGD